MRRAREWRQKEDGEKPLQRIDEKDQRASPDAKHTHDVRRTKVAGAVLPQVDTGPLSSEICGRDRARHIRHNYGANNGKMD
jgi:hypothetical protein